MQLYVKYDKCLSLGSFDNDSVKTYKYALCVINK